MPSPSAPNSARLLDRFERLVRVPTAPFREQWVVAELDRQLTEIPGLDVTVDRHGNRIAHFAARPGQSHPHVCFVAHLDHPGFVFYDDLTGADLVRPAGPGRHTAVAAFEGHVDDAFFPNAAVRLFRSAEDAGLAGRVVSATRLEGASDNRRVVIETEQDPAGAVLAMWDVPVFSVADGMARARVCDDLMGVASIVEAFARVGELGLKVNASAIFTRAEEAGFCGLLCLLDDHGDHAWLSRETLFLSIESPGETMTAKPGEGAIIRVGDKSTTFDGAIADELWARAVATESRARRALMDRGTCEATPLARAGYRAGGLCAPIRNYHNMDRDAQRIAPEQVAVGDMEALSTLIADLSLGSASATRPAPAVRLNYDFFLRKGRHRLGEQPAPSLLSTA